MTSATHDLCFLFIKGSLRKRSPERAVTCLQTDDTLSAGDKAFISKEKELNTFVCKEANFLENGATMTFNGAQLSNEKGVYIISQKEHIQKLATDDICKDAYISERARGAYIAAVSRPDLTFGFAYASHFQDPGATEVKFLNSCIARAKKTA